MQIVDKMEYEKVMSDRGSGVKTAANNNPSTKLAGTSFSQHLSKEAHPAKYLWGQKKAINELQISDLDTL